MTLRNIQKGLFQIGLCKEVKSGLTGQGLLKEVGWSQCCEAKEVCHSLSFVIATVGFQSRRITSNRVQSNQDETIDAIHLFVILEKGERERLGMCCLVSRFKVGIIQFDGRTDGRTKSRTVDR